MTTSFSLGCFVPKDQSDPSERVELVSKSFGRAGERSGLETSIRTIISLCVDFKAKGSVIIR